MKNTENKHSPFPRLPSPWIIAGAFVILLSIISVFAFRNAHRVSDHMSSVLIEKGEALIKSFEAGTRTGMKGENWNNRHIQKLIDETSSLSDISYIFITDSNGVVKAHSSKEIGTKIVISQVVQSLKSKDRDTWRVTESADGTKAFEVYSYFKPIGGPGPGGRMHAKRWMKHHPEKSDWFSETENTNANPSIIFIGLDMRHVDEARKADIRDSILISVVVFILGISGFVSLFWFQSYRITSRLFQDTSAFSNQVVTSLPVGLMATDKEGLVAFFNQSAELISGVHGSNIIGKRPDLILPRQWKAIAQAIETSESLIEQEMECFFPEGRVVPVSLSASRITNEKKEFIGTIIIFRNLEEVKALQEELRRNEKLAAMGSLSAGIAHEIRNPLSSIKGMATFFAGLFPEGSENRESSEVMIREVGRINKVITELLELSKPSDIKPRTSDVIRVIENTAKLVKQDAEIKNIQIRMNCSANVPEINVDPDRLSQTFLNLFINAIQAMSSGGSLEVSTALNKEDQVEIKFKDTGCGIDEKNIDMIFNPYYTTKKSGTGLGLAIVHKIIEAHKGTVNVKSTPGTGTEFTITLPKNKDL